MDTINSFTAKHSDDIWKNFNSMIFSYVSTFYVKTNAALTECVTTMF